MTIVDTSVWIDYLLGIENLHTLWLDRELARASLGLTDLILCEVLQGLRSEKSFVAIRRQLSEFQIFNTGGEEMAVSSARNYRLLRGRGLTVRKTADCIIATHCIRSGHSLLHRDRDFDPFERHLGLNVVHPQIH
jgi:predicted nucleic acid-binding protein